MSSRSVGVVTRSSRREQQVNIVGQLPTEHEQDQDDDDDDVVESTASAFDRAKRHKARGSQRGTLVVDLDSGGTTRVSKNRTHHQSEPHANLELNDSRRKSKAVAPVEEPKFNCPICLCPFTEEMSTKCGHLFCKSCITDAISLQAKCPTCRKEVTAKDLIRVFLPGWL